MITLYVTNNATVHKTKLCTIKSLIEMRLRVCMRVYVNVIFRVRVRVNIVQLHFHEYFT